MVLRRIQSAGIYLDSPFRGRNQLDSCETVTFAVTDANEVAADDTVCRDNVPLDFHGNVQAVESAGIVKRLDVFKRKTHHEVLLGGIHHAEFFGDIQLFFQLKVRECLVASNVQVPRMFIFFGEAERRYEQKKE